MGRASASEQGRKDFSDGHDQSEGGMRVIAGDAADRGGAVTPDSVSKSRKSVLQNLQNA